MHQFKTCTGTEPYGIHRLYPLFILSLGQNILVSKIKLCLMFFALYLSYVDYYKLPQPTDNVLELLAFIARKHNYTTQQKSLTG